jgi:transposase
MRPEGSPRELERRRQRAIDLLRDGAQPVEVARMVGVDRRSVRRWWSAYRKRGAAGIAARPASGRPPKLVAAQRRQLERALLRGAQAYGFDSELWSCPRVARVVEHEFQIQYHVDHVGRLLRSLGWSPQRPARRARERDEAAIHTWVKTQWPRIKKKRTA